MPETEQTTPDDNGPEDVRELREAFKREREGRRTAEASNSEAEAMRRENVMLRAGVDLDSPQGQYFARGFEGELTVEAVTAEWAKLAPTAPPPGEETETPDPEEVERQRRRDALQGGGHAPGEEPSQDPWEAAYATFHENRRNGMTRERAAVGPIGQILAAAQAGDERVLYDPERWFEEHSTR